jgi:hypothetical protein
LRAFDVSGMGRGTDAQEGANDGGEEEEEHVGEIPATGDRRSVRIIRKLSLPYFRDKLVQHFDILFRQNKIKWPTRMGAPAPPTLNY